jgi:outer membrane protein
MKLKQSGLIILLFLISIISNAQSELNLTVDEAVDYALQYNKTVANSELSITKAQQGIREAIANGLPQVNASVDYSNAMGANMSIRFNENMPASEIPIKPSSSFNLQVTQLLFSGSYIVGVQTAKLYKELSEYNQHKTESDIKTQVTNSYYLVLISEELLMRLQQNLANLKELHKKTEALSSVGIIERTDVDQLFIQVTTLENAVKSSERQLELAVNMLRLQLGTDINTQINLTEKLDNVLSQNDIEKTMMQTLNLQNNLDYLMMDQQVEISKKMVDMKKTAALPNLSGFYSYTYKLLRPEFDMAPANMIGLQLNVPVFSSGLRNAQTKQAFIDMQIQQNNREQVSDQLLVQEKQLKFNLLSALETFNNLKSNIEVSRRVYSSIKLKYEQGLISGLDLITADNNYLKAETDYISAAMQLLDARLQLEKMYITAN